MLLISNDDVAAGGLSDRIVAQAYNALDAALTVEIHERLQEYLADDEDARRTYDFQRAMLGPSMTMAMRGIRVDEDVARKRIAELKAKHDECLRRLHTLARVWGDEEFEFFNPASPLQVKRLVYEICGEVPYRSADGRDTANEDALVQLIARSPVVGVIAVHILRCRELQKAQTFLKAKRSPDGRLRSSFNVAATTSGRWSFSKDAFGDGLNFGNIPRDARDMFVPSFDDWVMVNTDLKQAESNFVGRISRDAGYVHAHETGDVHRAVANMLWPAGAQHLLRGMSPRKVAKAVGHGTNYGVGEGTSSKLTGLPIPIIREFRTLFFGKFPGVKARIEGIGQRIAENPRVVSILGRPHQFLGDPRDGNTQRAALADEPQGGVADVLNVALWRLWKKHDVGNEHPRIRLLSQAYDSILFECHKDDVAAARAAVDEAMHVELAVDGETFVIPHDIGVGANWKEATS